MTSSNPELTKLRKEAGELAKAQNWGEKAFEINKKILEIEPHTSDALTRLGCCYQTQGDFITARDMYRQALKSDPSNTVARSKLKGVEEYAREQEEKIKKEANMQRQKARREKQKNKISSITDFNEVYQLGLAKKKHFHFDLAIVAFLRTIELKPESPHAWVSLGSAYRQSGNAAEALKAFERALELGADQDFVFAGMAAAKHMTGDTASAINLYDQVLKHDNCNIYALKGRAALYNYVGDIENAKKLFGRVHYLTNKKDK